MLMAGLYLDDFSLIVVLIELKLVLYVLEF